MPDERSFPRFAAEFDYAKSVGKAENQWNPKSLQINKYLNRPLASVIARAVYRTRVTPNQLTGLAFFIGLAGDYSFFQGRPGAFVLGGILTQLSSIVDCSDGMLARARGQMSDFGAYLDLFLDRLNEFFLMTGCAVGYFRYSGRLSLLIIGLSGVGLYFLETSLFYLMKHYANDRKKGETAEDRGWLLFLIFLFAATNRLDYGLGLLFVGSTAINVFLTFKFFRLRNV